MQAVLAPVQTEPASFPLDLPSSILYPDFEFSPPEPGSADSLPAFQVDTLSKANWCVSRVLEAEDRIARRAELAAELHSRIDNWMAKASTADNDSISYLSLFLRPFVDSELSTQRRSRSLLLPSGTASLRKLPDRLDIVDREAALAYCKTNHPEAVIIKEDLAKSALKSLIFSQGEAIPGISAELGSTELYIKHA
jgi:hypothetical protein